MARWPNLENGTDSTLGDRHLLRLSLPCSSTRAVSPKAALGAQGLHSTGAMYAPRGRGVGGLGVVGRDDLDGRVFDLDGRFDLDGLDVAGDLMDHVLVLHLLVGLDP